MYGKFAFRCVGCVCLQSLGAMLVALAEIAEDYAEAPCIEALLSSSEELSTRLKGGEELRSSTLCQVIRAPHCRTWLKMMSSGDAQMIPLLG